MNSEHQLSLLKGTGADSVYILLHQGWKNEARANRWHFATRWARHLPVVLVNPDTAWAGHVSRREPRIENARILKVISNFGPIWGRASQIQTAQILDDMERNGFRHPILWLYNAGFAEAFAALPAIARVHHVTENYFDFPSMSQLYLNRVALVSTLADLNVSVSEGCAIPLHSFADRRRIMVATNGCDFKAYSQDTSSDPEVLTLRDRFNRLGVFGGNINDRLDFDLLDQAVRINADTCFLFVGAVNLSANGRRRFSSLRHNPNVQAIGKVAPDRLPAIYNAADFGFIPYVRQRWIVDNGFPLKALEMAATGLPVVSTYMKALAPYSPPLAVAQSDPDFLSAIAQARRHSNQAEALKALAAENDYDARFATIVERMASIPKHQGSQLDAFAAAHPRPAGATITNTTLGATLKNTIMYGLRYRYFVAATKVVDALPPPFRKFIIRTKRALMSRTTTTP